MKKTRFALLCVVVAGCGSGNSTASLESFVKDMAGQQCAWEYRCCTDSEIKVQDGTRFMSQDACVPYRQLTLLDELYVNRLAVRQGRIRLDDTKAKACIAQMTAQSCNPKPGQPAPMPTMDNVDACADVFIGATKAGDPCEFAGECVKGAHCVTDALTPGSGVCVPYQEESAICNGSKDCDPTVTQLYCAQQDWKCHKRATLGQPCAYTMNSAGKPTLPLLLECDTTNAKLYCDPTSSTCKALPVAGEACLSSPPPGVLTSCDPDPTLRLKCVTAAGSTAGVCTPPAQANQDCTNVACDTGLYCDTSTTTARVCKPLPGLGQPCTPTSEQCAAPYFCNFTKSPYVCAQPAQLNDPCSNGTPCDTGLYCDVTCKPALADGQPCTSSLQCLSEYCDGTVVPRVCGPTQAPTTVVCEGRN